MRKLYLAAALGFTLASFAACFPSLEMFEDAASTNAAGANGPSGPGSGAGKGNGGSGAGTTEGTGANVGSGASDGGTLGPCDLRSGMHGSPGVVNPGQFVSNRCIDSHEASWDEYILFLKAFGNFDSSNRIDAGSINRDCEAKDRVLDTPYQPARYIWNDYNSDPGDAGDLPVQGVDWCDAYLYCHWAGKELCGSASGAPIDPLTDSNWPADGEWYDACHNFKEWPNGPECYDPPNAGEVFSEFPVDSNCQQGGIHHMLSNVWEWENNCFRDGGEGGHELDDCRSRGQPNEQGGLAPPCDNVENHWSPRVAQDAGEDYTGIRCCWSQKKTQ